MQDTSWAKLCQCMYGFLHTPWQACIRQDGRRFSPRRNLAFGRQYPTLLLQWHHILKPACGGYQILVHHARTCVKIVIVCVLGNRMASTCMAANGESENRSREMSSPHFRGQPCSCKFSLAFALAPLHICQVLGDRKTPAWLGYPPAVGSPGWRYRLCSVE